MLRRFITTGVEPRNQFERFHLRNQGALLVQEWYAPGSWTDEQCQTWLGSNPNVVQAFHWGFEPYKEIAPAYMVLGFDHCPVVICRLQDGLYWSAPDWIEDHNQATQFSDSNLAQHVIDSMGISINYLPMRLLCDSNSSSAR
jgi:hypothetical protein